MGTLSRSLQPLKPKKGRSCRASRLLSASRRYMSLLGEYISPENVCLGQPWAQSWSGCACASHRSRWIALDRTIERRPTRFDAARIANPPESDSNLASVVTQNSELTPKERRRGERRRRNLAVAPSSTCPPQSSLEKSPGIPRSAGQSCVPRKASRAQRPGVRGGRGESCKTSSQ